MYFVCTKKILKSKKAQNVLNMNKTIFDEISDTYPDMNHTQIRNTLAAFLFTGDDVYKLISDLSGGERGRVSLAKLMLSESNFLIASGILLIPFPVIQSDSIQIVLLLVII